MEDSIHPLSGRIYKNLSLIYRDLQEDEEAVKYLDKAIVIFQETFSKENLELRAAIELKSQFEGK